MTERDSIYQTLGKVLQIESTLLQMGTSITKCGEHYNKVG